MANTPDRTSELGRNIRSLREARGWSRRTLAMNAGTSDATIARVELYGAAPNVKLIHQLAEAFDVEPGSLFGNAA